jgi:citronellol/citronellal dehydrogenase
MNQINGRGTWLTSKLCLPHLLESAKKGRNPHIVILAPPPDLRKHWFRNHVGYTMSKYAMSLCTIGLSAELSRKIAVNGLWPLTTIETSGISN